MIYFDEESQSIGHSAENTEVSTSPNLDAFSLIRNLPFHVMIVLNESKQCDVSGISASAANLMFLCVARSSDWKCGDIELATLQGTQLRVRANLLFGAFVFRLRQLKNTTVDQNEIDALKAHVPISSNLKHYQPTPDSHAATRQHYSNAGHFAKLKGCENKRTT
ncbi:hypothetical protein EGR_08321 [Echinococcus granulosus]|uniref:Uncharacterized protein n=1 Tax=Echinococcus granulosus TaxID=6210 RepID=W6UFC3_ECHGR|nr:hypothetical protein EGR_08321 [Echinococcus granulosus]EUB56852.1 hypothetical protein EGR_08321 [Echinococcus granulosus]